MKERVRDCGSEAAMTGRKDEIAGQARNDEGWRENEIAARGPQ